MTWAATADAADMSMGDSPKDCEEMGDEDDGRSIAEVATAGREIGGCKGHKKCSPKVHGQQDKFKGTQLKFSMITKCTCLDSEDVTALACCMRWLWFVAAEDDDAEPEDTAEPEDALCRGNTR